MSIDQTKKFSLIPSAWTLIISNVGILTLAIIFDWSLFGIVLTYWIENVIIGILNIPKILMARADHPGHRPYGLGSKIFLVFFFCFHYTVFTAVHGGFVVFLFAEASDYSSGKELFENTFDGFYIVAIALLFLSHFYSFYTNFYRSKEYKSISPFQQMLKPYIRIFVVHAFIIFGGYIILLFENGMLILLILFMIVKTGLDLFAHLQEHKKKRN